MHERKLPENVNVTIANPGVDAVMTKLSELGLGLAAFYVATNKKLNLILDSIGAGDDPATVAKIRAAAAKLKAGTDTLEGAVQEHSSEGQG
jgi:hypothetical protein